jgi:alpha-glucosidase
VSCLSIFMHCPITDKVTVVKAHRLPHGGQFKLGGSLEETFQVDFLRDGVIRLRISRNGAFEEHPTHAVSVDLDGVRVSCDWREDEGLVNMASSGALVTVRLDPLNVSVQRADGSRVLEEAPVGRDFYRETDSGFTVTHGCGAEDAFYGLGQKTGSFNRRGRDLILWNSDVLNPNVSGGYREAPGDDPMRDPTSTMFDPYYISIPFFYHRGAVQSGMAGYFCDNSHRGRFDFSEADHFTFGFEGGAYTEYVFTGPAMRDILGSYTWLTGRMAVPPLWALGHHQCRWHDYNQRQVEELAANLRREEVPCDVLWLDIDYMDGFRVFTWDDERFPDPVSLMRLLEDKKFRIITIIDPGVKSERGYRVYDEGRERGHFCLNASGEIYEGQVWPGLTAFPDFSKQETRAWWGRLNAEHVRSGLAGIWNDMNEPATGDIPAEGMLFGDGKFSHERYHNQYALLMAMGTVAGLLEAMPDRRTFVLSRAGSAGIQRYAANWLGDNVSRWDHLWLAMPMALGLGVSGQPFVGADVGGFMGQCGPELLVRWYQYGALTPFCRNHNAAGQPAQYAWAFDDETESLCREALRLRYRLMPSIYSEFIASSETGLPVQRPLLLEFQEQEEAWDLDDQYMFGPHLMVAPVYKPGATSREVWLPPGTWFDWHTGEALQGGRRFVAEAPLDRIPLYARGGSVVACWPEAPESTMGYHPEEIILHIFVPQEDGVTRSMLQEDDGLTFAFRRGGFVRTDFTLERRGSRIVLRANATGSGYPEFARRRFVLKLHGIFSGSMILDGSAVRLYGDSMVLANTGENFVWEADVAASPLKCERLGSVAVS